MLKPLSDDMLIEISDKYIGQPMAAQIATMQASQTDTVRQIVGMLQDHKSSFPYSNKVTGEDECAFHIPKTLWQELKKLAEGK